VTAGRGVEGTQITLKPDPQGAIAGKVVCEGKPVENATVQISRQGLTDHKTTDHEGKFSFQNVEKAVDVTVTAPGYNERKLSEVRPGKTDLVIEIGRAGFPVTGKVTLDKSVPVSNIVVTAWFIDPATGKEVGEKSTCVAFGPYPEFPMFSYGIYLAEGSYKMVFSARGYESEERSVTITNRPETISDVTLKPKR